MSDKNKSNAPKKPGEGMASAVVEEAIEGTAGKAGKTIGKRLFEKKAVSAALKIAKIGFFGKAVIAAACVAVIMGCVCIPILTPSPSEASTPAAPSGGVISGTYIDDFSGMLTFTFTGDKVTLKFEGNPDILEGTFTAENGVLYIDTPEQSMFSRRDIPYTLEGGGDTLIIDGGNKFTRQ